VTNDPLRDLILYRLDRAQESLEEALLMQREEHWNACANRLYYSCFYISPIRRFPYPLPTCGELSRTIADCIWRDV
jgi:hypothetical protein